MNKAFYHQHGKAPLELDVIKAHKDGKIDIGHEGQDPLVINCPVHEDPRPGCATLMKEDKAPKESKKGPKEPEEK